MIFGFLLADQNLSGRRLSCGIKSFAQNPIPVNECDKKGKSMSRENVYFNCKLAEKMTAIHTKNAVREPPYVFKACALSRQTTYCNGDVLFRNMAQEIQFFSLLKSITDSSLVTLKGVV